MKNIILDYSSFVIEEHEYALKGPMEQVVKTVHNLPNDYDLFFKVRGHCPSCNIVADNVFTDEKTIVMGKELFDI